MSQAPTISEVVLEVNLDPKPPWNNIGELRFSVDRRNWRFRWKDPEKAASGRTSRLMKEVSAMWEMDRLPRVIPERYLWGKEFPMAGNRDISGANDRQIRVFFPSSPAAGYSFGLRYLETAEVDALGYCYRDGESIFNDRPKGVFTDPDGIDLRELTATFVLLLSEEGLPILREQKRAFSASYREIRR
jgi:hypothetical protein